MHETMRYDQPFSSYKSEEIFRLNLVHPVDQTPCEKPCNFFSEAVLVVNKRHVTRKLKTCTKL